MTSAEFFVRKLVVTALFALSMFGCTTNDQISGCKEVMSGVVTVRLIERFNDQVDGQRASLGRFELINNYKGDLKIDGWQRPAGFLILEPVARVQLRKDEKWVEILTMMGSWMLTGESVMVVPYQEKRMLFLRLDSAVPDGKHEMRVVIVTKDETCLVSDSFFSQIKSDPKS